MNLFRELRSCYRALFRRAKLDADMAEEMRVHLEMQVRQNLAEGMSPRAAHDAARRQFGHLEGVKEIVRDQRGWSGLDHTQRDFRYALRQLRRSPVFTLFVLLTLALGIGSSTAIFSVVHALLLSPLRYREADRLVQVQSFHRELGIAGFAPATFGDLVSGNTSFAALTAQYYYYVNLTGTETPALVNSADVTADYFNVFGVTPLRGRVWGKDDLKAGANPVVVLSHGLWRRQFHASDEIIGQRIILDDVAYTVLGVMPPAFKDPSEVAQLWRPMRPGADNLLDRNSRYWTVFGRLKPDVAPEQANTELALFARQLQQAHPKNYEAWTMRAVDLHHVVVGDYHSGLLVVLGAVGCVMLITCANVTGLSIVRATARRKELAIRTALGSSRGRLVRQLLTESVILAVLGGVGGVLLARWGMEAILASLPESWLPRADEIALNFPVLGTSLALSVVTGVVSGLAPGFAASRSDPGDALKESVRSTPGRAARRLRAALVVTELALALILLAGAGLLGRSFLGLIRTQSGIDAERVLAVTLSLPGARYDRPAKCWDFFSRAQAEVAALPGVQAADFTQTSPFRWGIPAVFSPEQPKPSGELPRAFADSVGVDYFKAVGIPLRSGRSFTAADDYKTPAIAILSETTARRYFGTENPLGRFITGTVGGSARFEVVGVVGDVRRSGLTVETPLQVYFPLAQRSPAFATLMIRTALPPATLAKSVQAAVWRVDPNIPITDVATMDTFVSRSVTQPRLYLTLFTFFGALALLLAGIGLYGLIAYGVEQRTHEFGIRAALGASPREVLALVLREGALLIGLGVATGLVGAFAAARLLRNLVFETSLHDPQVFLLVPLVLASVAVLACWLPARRATKIHPMVALRCE
jgi:putative ABC transport system permease protein